MAITDLDEQLLVRAHQAGDEHAFGQIVRSQHRALYAHAYKRLGSHESAEDAVQDTLLRAYRAMPSFDGDLRLRAWLHRILTNVCHDEGNRRRRQVGLIEKLEAQPVELGADPVDEAVLHDTVQIMNSAIAELPESYREALVLRYVDGLSFRDVAETIGTTEENARARVHRGRVALHKILSRVSVMVAFLVPGLRRTQIAPTDATTAASSAEPSISLVTQLTSHAVTHAPAISRVAEVATATSGAKSSMVATAVAAVAAVAAPVAAYKVYDTAQQPSAPPPAVAAPAEENPAPITSTTTIIVKSPAAGPIVADTTTSAPSTSSTLPRSAAEPFGISPAAEDPEPTTTTAAPPTTSTTVAPSDVSGPIITGTISGDAFQVQGTRPDFDVTGHAVLDGTEDPVTGTLAGRVYVADVVGGEAITELTMTADDGQAFRVRFRGTVASEESDDSTTTWTMTGRYIVEGGEAAGLAERGTATVEFRWGDGAPSLLSFALEGQQPTG